MGDSSGAGRPPTFHVAFGMASTRESMWALGRTGVVTFNPAGIVTSGNKPIAMGPVIGGAVAGVAGAAVGMLLDRNKEVVCEVDTADEAVFDPDGRLAMLRRPDGGWVVLRQLGGPVGWLRTPKVTPADAEAFAQCLRVAYGPRLRQERIVNKRLRSDVWLLCILFGGLLVFLIVIAILAALGVLD